MAAVRVVEIVRGTVHEAEELWYDTSRWPAWIDGLGEVTAVEGPWPKAGSQVRWVSGPAGRGTVLERVVEHTPLEGQTLEVQDDSIAGRQQVVFMPADGGVEVELTLDYRLKKRSILTPLLDALFIRRAMAISLQTTLARFATELASASTH